MIDKKIKQIKLYIPMGLLVVIVGLMSSVGRSQDVGTIVESGIFSFRKTRETLHPDRLDRDLLERAIIYFTNREREKHRLRSCRYEEKLREAARSHSEEMVRHRYFSHESPIPENRELLDRIKKVQIPLANTVMGENIGVDYLLKIAGVPYYKTYRQGKIVYISVDTEEPIGYQSYWDFAKSMVDNWMKSSGHRENILNEKFDRIGIGVAAGAFKGFDAIYVTQNFIGPIHIIN
jgi:uncharacterized protein YkwD